MAGRGMGAATRGGGCVGTGPRNKMESKPSRKVGDPVMMKDGGDAGEVAKKTPSGPPMAAGIGMAIDALVTAITSSSDKSSSKEAKKLSKKLAKKKRGGMMYK